MVLLIRINQVSKHKCLEILTVIMSQDFNRYIPVFANAILARHSIRNYLPDAVSPEIFTNLEQFIQQIAVPFSHQVKMSLHYAPEGKKIYYFPQPECFAAFIAPTSVQDQAKLGFCGELFILFAVSLGLSTCWMGHFWKKTTYEIVFGTYEKSAPEILYCTTPIGYRDENLNLLSKLTLKLFGKKKSVEEKLHPDSLQHFPEAIYKALDYACKAPSAMNNQCWRFTIKQASDQYTVVINKPRGYRHFKWPYVNIDVGTSAAHFWVGLNNQKVPTTIKIEDDGETVDWIFIIDKKHLK
ncbi:MAG: hypothetical protein RBG13Loki_2800 [Promethearchaeota archaeon CR_4]|nr:MAG: hypothetical protein RBG13Loki_2800 [Candidatus Lokiarchaeota archaeon CR_4]